MLIGSITLAALLIVNGKKSEYLAQYQSEFKELKAERLRIKSDVEMLNNVLKKQTTVSRIMSNVASAVPDKMVLSNFSIDLVEDSLYMINVSGFVRIHSDIVAFMDTVENKFDFKNPQMISAETSKEIVVGKIGQQIAFKVKMVR
jgi:Tfp pilus assembly protein PilN